MADKPDDAPKKPTTVKLDGDHVVNMLKGAGLDPHKIDVRKALPGAHVDYDELQSRLRGTHAAVAKPTSGWHVHVSVSKD
jgi:hypothetical protein